VKQSERELGWGKRLGISESVGKRIFLGFRLDGWRTVKVRGRKPTKQLETS
jgi:hypothetical protein